MKKIIFILFLTAPVFASGQNLSSFLQDIEKNNLQLIVLQKWLEAEDQRARTGIFPANPEARYNFLFGNSEAIGNQQELEIMQPFKFPGYYSAKAELQNLQFEQKQLLVKQERLAIMHMARAGYFNMVWLNKKKELLETRKNESEKLVGLMKQGFESGEVSKPAYDKAIIYNIGVEAEWQMTISDIDIQNERLKQLNGGLPVDNLTWEFPADEELLPVDSLLAYLLSQNPELMMAQLGIEEYDANIKYEKMNQLPAFEAGYRSEKILNQKLRGIHAGIEIPLWSNKNRIKHARMLSEWSRSNLNLQESRLHTEVVSKYNEVQNLHSIYNRMKEIAGDENLSENSLQLLHSGQISFPEYLLETQFIYEMKSKFLETERNYYIAVSGLKQLFSNDFQMQSK
jgi:outer membrane protein, heavy metal efflux system